MLLLSFVALAGLYATVNAYGKCADLRAMILNEDKKCCAYWLQGVRHVGIGLNLDRSSKATMRAYLATVGADFDKVYAGTECLTESQISRLHTEDVKVYEACMKAWMGSTWNTMNADQQSALIDMAYTMGCAGTRQFASMKASIVAGDYYGAARHMEDSKWCRQQATCRCQRAANCLSPGIVVQGQGCTNCICDGTHPDPDFCDPTPMPPPLPPNVDCETSDPICNRCSAPCEGKGSQICQLSVTRPASGSGKPCPPLTFTKVCDGAACPKDCIVGAYSCPACTASCGRTAQQICTRSVVRAAQAGGLPCPRLSDPRTCYGPPCPTDCELSEWNCDSCNAACGAKGSQFCSRYIKTSPTNGGKPCDRLTEIRDCDGPACPVPCVTSPYKCGNCNAACGTKGKRTCTTTVLQQPRNGGKACPPLTTSFDCDGPACPQDCVLSPGWECGPCNALCNQSGDQRCVKKVLEYPANGGKLCGSTFELRSCSGPPCPPVPVPPVDCVVASHPKCKTCDAACDQRGKKFCELEVITPPANGGKKCPTNLITYQDCDGPECAKPPVDCVEDDWICPACTAKCGERAYVTCTRTIKTNPSVDGEKCGELTKRQLCYGDPCPATNCKTSDWSEWTKCSADCGGGIRTKTRTIERQASNNGEPCGDLTDFESCNEHACPRAQPPVDCELSRWSEWGKCSASCTEKSHIGEKTKYRAILVPPAHNGLACDQLRFTVPCKAECSEPECANPPCEKEPPSSGEPPEVPAVPQKLCYDSRGVSCDPATFASGIGVQCGCECYDTNGFRCVPPYLTSRKRTTDNKKRDFVTEDDCTCANISTPPSTECTLLGAPCLNGQVCQRDEATNQIVCGGGATPEKPPAECETGKICTNGQKCVLEEGVPTCSGGDAPPCPSTGFCADGSVCEVYPHGKYCNYCEPQSDDCGVGKLCVLKAGGYSQCIDDPNAALLAGSSQVDGLGIPLIAGISAAAVCCLIIIIGLIVLAACVLCTSAPAAGAAVYQPTSDNIVEGNPLFYSGQQKSYNPIFYPAASGGGGGVGAGGSIDMVPMAGGAYPAAAAYPAGAYGTSDSGIYNNGGAFVCTVCQGNYPTQADLEHHCDKRHGGQGASYAGAGAALGGAFTCDLCDKNYPTAEDLAHHKSIRHF